MGSRFAVVRREDNPAHIVVTGEVDIDTAPDLHGSLCRAVDLAAVSFIDGRGLRVLAVADAYACVRGVRLVFASVPAFITRLLRITRVSLHGLDAKPP